MHENKLLGILAFCAMVAMAVFFSPRHGWLTLGNITLVGSLWGLVFGTEIRLRYFGRNFLLRGVPYKAYCAFALAIGIAIIWYSLPLDK